MTWYERLWPITSMQRGEPFNPRLGRSPLPAATTARPPVARVDNLAEDQENRAIRCVACRAAITHQQQATAINGRHQHAFFNPAGIAFELRCFHAAPGTIVHGPATTEFTWFAGYSWQVALCASCHIHLGWQFTGNGAFYGLIADRLI